MVVDTLLGIVLLSAAAFPFVIALLGFYLVDQSIRHFWPEAVHHQQATWMLFLSSCSLIGCVSYLRKRMWALAFLSIAAIPMILSAFLPTAQRPLRFEDILILCLIPVVSVPFDSASRRLHFLAGASIIGVVIAVNTGVVGSGSFARIVSDCILAAGLIWFVIDMRQISARRN